MKAQRKKKLTQGRLKGLLNYNPDTGVFTWRVNRGGTARAGSVAGRVNDLGYRTILVDMKRYKAARLAWFYMEGYWPEHDIDHEDRVRDNNRWSNLRHVTRRCNIRNTGIRECNKSGIKGVSFDKNLNKWKVQITTNGTNKYVGVFAKKKDAAIARIKAEEMYGYKPCDGNSSAYQYVYGGI